MGLLTKLFRDAADAEFKLAQDLVAMAMADGEISEEERKAILEICRKEGILPEVAEGCLQGMDTNNGKSVIPANRKEKCDYIKKLIRVMGVDGNSSHMEIYLLEIIAARMGLSHMDVLSLVLMTATHQNFPGCTGLEVLKSFTKNAIDPKGKTLQENRENLRTLFDIMAENTATLENEADDQEAFVQAMNHSMGLMMENTNLAQDFSAIGIDFETVLMNEREQAIRRWLNVSSLTVLPEEKERLRLSGKL
jgi:uncharacterized tellurite resistance protein B-like protein